MYLSFCFGETGIDEPILLSWTGIWFRTTTTRIPEPNPRPVGIKCGYHSLALGAGGVFSDGKYVPLTPKGFIVYFARFGKSIRYLQTDCEC